MSTVIYGLIAIGFLVGAVLVMLAFTKAGSFLDSILKPISDRLKKRFELSMVEEAAKLAKAHEDMEAAREKANVAFLSAEEAKRRLQVAQSPEYKKNIELKMISKLAEQNEKLRQRIDELKKRQGAK
jgi:hypothetical protein